MDDYIKREQALKLIESAGAWGWSNIILYDEMQALPAADVAPVVHGRWETNADDEEEIKDFTCSACKYQLCDIDTSVIVPGENDFYFCPNCGATMNQEDQI